MPLQHYDAVDRIGFLAGVLFKEGGRVVVRGVAKLHVDNVEEFMEVLGQVDDAVEFFGGSRGGRRCSAGRGAPEGAAEAGAARRRGEAAGGHEVIGPDSTKLDYNRYDNIIVPKNRPYLARRLPARPVNGP